MQRTSPIIARHQIRKIKNAFFIFSILKLYVEQSKKDSNLYLPVSQISVSLQIDSSIILNFYAQLPNNSYEILTVLSVIRTGLEPVMQSHTIRYSTVIGTYTTFRHLTKYSMYSSVAVLLIPYAIKNLTSLFILITAQFFSWLEFQYHRECGQHFTILLNYTMNHIDFYFMFPLLQQLLIQRAILFKFELL